MRSRRPWNSRQMAAAVSKIAENFYSELEAFVERVDRDTAHCASPGDTAAEAEDAILAISDSTIRRVCRTGVVEELLGAERFERLLPEQHQMVAQFLLVKTAADGIALVPSLASTMPHVRSDVARHALRLHIVQVEPEIEEWVKPRMTLNASNLYAAGGTFAAVESSALNRMLKTINTKMSGARHNHIANAVVKDEIEAIGDVALDRIARRTLTPLLDSERLANDVGDVQSRELARLVVAYALMATTQFAPTSWAPRLAGQHPRLANSCEAAFRDLEPVARQAMPPVGAELSIA